MLVKHANLINVLRMTTNEPVQQKHLFYPISRPRSRLHLLIRKSCVNWGLIIMAGYEPFFFRKNLGLHMDEI